MKIKIIKTDSGVYRADLLDLVGLPEVGIGNTPAHAVGRLMYTLLLEVANFDSSWINCIDFRNCVIEEPIEGK